VTSSPTACQKVCESPPSEADSPQETSFAVASWAGSHWEPRQVSCISSPSTCENVNVIHRQMHFTARTRTLTKRVSIYSVARPMLPVEYVEMLSCQAICDQVKTLCLAWEFSQPQVTGWKRRLRRLHRIYASTRES
jgi:hypothetical protein